MDKLRVYVPAHKGLYYVESPFVKLADGSLSRSEVVGIPQLKDKLWTEREAAKGLLVIDPDMSAEDCYNVNVAVSAGRKGAEHGSIHATVKATADAAATFKVGLASAIPAFILDKEYTTGDPTITGTYGEDSLKAIGDLAVLNGVNVNKIHCNASDDAVYAESVELVTVTSTKSKKSDYLEFPKSDSNDENTTIRNMDAAYFKANGLDGGLRFNGMNHLNFAIPAGQDVTLTFYTTFTPK